MNSKSKILTRQELVNVLEPLRQQGNRIVLTNGCFDILHVGHARYLELARTLGDLLVVGVNTDSSIHEFKGPNRPIVPENERAEMLAFLGCVDYVTLFDERLPNALVEAVKPAFHVKAGDYTPEQMPETPIVRANGGEVVILPYLQGHSTTGIIERVVDVYKQENRDAK